MRFIAGLIVCSTLPFSAFALRANFPIFSNLVQQTALCDGNNCIAQSVIDGDVTAMTPEGASQQLTLTGVGLNGNYFSGLFPGTVSMSGTGGLFIQNWNGSDTGSFSATLTLNLQGTTSLNPLGDADFLIMDDSAAFTTLQIPPSTGFVQITADGLDRYIESYFNVFASFVVTPFPTDIVGDTQTSTLFRSAGYDEGAVPEPGTFLLLSGVAIVGLGLRKLRRTV